MLPYTRSRKRQQVPHLCFRERRENVLLEPRANIQHLEQRLRESVSPQNLRHLFFFYGLRHGKRKKSTTHGGGGGSGGGENTKTPQGTGAVKSCYYHTTPPTPPKQTHKHTLHYDRDMLTRSSCARHATQNAQNCRCSHTSASLTPLPINRRRRRRGSRGRHSRLCVQHPCLRTTTTSSIVALLFRLFYPPPPPCPPALPRQPPEPTPSLP